MVVTAAESKLAKCQAFIYGPLVFDRFPNPQLLSLRDKLRISVLVKKEENILALLIAKCSFKL